MTTDITELAQSLKEAAEHYQSVQGIARYSKTADAKERFLELANPANIIALVEALEKAQQRISELESPTFTFEVTAEPFTCPRCGTTTTHPEGWHYCHKREGE